MRVLILARCACLGELGERPNWHVQYYKKKKKKKKIAESGWSNRGKQRCTHGKLSSHY